MRNLIRALRGKPVELSPKQQEKMAKAQARADAIIAEREAAGRKAMEDAAAFMATQGGGGERRRADAGPVAGSFDPGQPLPPVRELFKQALDTAKDSFGEMFDDRAGIIDPGPGADLNKPPPELEDPAEREQRAAAERAARDEARAPYLAATRPAVELTRFATTGRAQLEDVIERLRHYDPARVFGVYRVPDRYELNRNSENEVHVEWEIAHAPGAAADGEVHMAASTAPATGSHAASASRRCSTRTSRARSCARAGLQPEDCFGLTAPDPRPRQRHRATASAGRARRRRARRSAAPPLAESPARATAWREAPLALAAGRAAVPRRDPRLGGGRRVGLARPATARRARPRRCRTSRATGRS